MKKVFFLQMATIMLFASCGSDNDDSQPTGSTTSGFNGKVELGVNDFILVDDTRSSLKFDGNKISFDWGNADAVGVLQISPKGKSQTYQLLSNGTKTSSYTTFDGSNWSLCRGNIYSIYYPFQSDVASDYMTIPIDMVGQVQDGNTSLNHIAKGYDYMYATATVPEEANASFNFNHVISIVQLNVTMPVSASWKSVSLSANDNVFVTKATMNISNGQVSSTERASSVTLYLNNISTTTAYETLTLYLAVLPTTTGELTISAISDEGKTYSASLNSKTFVSGYAYSLAATLNAPLFVCDGIKDGYAYVDLGLSVKWATMNVGATTITGYGSHYAWAETQTKSYYYAENNKYYDNNTLKYTKYNNTDKITTLEKMDDVAAVSWGGSWRIPKASELKELVNNCYWVWTDNYNNSTVAGYIIYKAKSPSDKGEYVAYSTPSSDYSLSDTHIFLPASGHYEKNQYLYAGSAARYWSASLYGSVAHGLVNVLTFSKNNRSVVANNTNQCDRRFGNCVRAVYE